MTKFIFSYDYHGSLSGSQYTNVNMVLYEKFLHHWLCWKELTSRLYWRIHDIKYVFPELFRSGEAPGQSLWNIEADALPFELNGIHGFYMVQGHFQ